MSLDVGAAGARVDRLNPDASQLETRSAKVFRAAFACAGAGRPGARA